jgi:O-antigen/teichoic acid export membrane protein
MQANPLTPNPLASHWHAGGWFGSQLGGTAWLFVAALVVASESPQSAVVLLGCGAASNLVGCLLWAQRARLDPYRALQILVVVIVLAGAFATRWLELRGEFDLLDPRVRPRIMYLLLFVLLLVLLAVFESKRRAASKAAAA